MIDTEALRGGIQRKSELRSEIHSIDRGSRLLLGGLDISVPDVPGTAAVIDAIRGFGELPPEEDDMFTQRVVANMKRSLIAGKGYAIVNADDPGDILTAAVLDEEYLRPSVTRNPIGTQRPVMRAMISYKDESGSAVVLADTAGRSADQHPYSLLRQFFGDRTFALENDGLFAAATKPGRDKPGLALEVTEEQFDRSAVASLAAVAAEDAEQFRVAALDRSVMFLGKVGVKIDAFRGHAGELDDSAQQRLTDMIVTFLADKELIYRRTTDRYNAAPHYTNGRELQVTERYPRLVGLGDDIAAQVLQKVGPFRNPHVRHPQNLVRSSVRYTR